MRTLYASTLKQLTRRTLYASTLKPLYASTLKQNCNYICYLRPHSSSGNMSVNTDLYAPDTPVLIPNGAGLASDRLREVLGELDQTMERLSRTLMPAQIVRAPGRLSERATDEVRYDGAPERSAVASVGAPDGQLFAAAARISSEILSPGEAPDGAQPGGTVMCSTAEAVAASESRRLDIEAKEKDGGFGAMASPESVHKACHGETTSLEAPSAPEVEVRDAVPSQPLIGTSHGTTSLEAPSAPEVEVRDA